MSAKDYFGNWIVLVYALYLFFNKGMSYSFLAEGTLLIGVLLAIRERNKIQIVWDIRLKLLALLLLLNIGWVVRGITQFPAFDVIRDSFIFNYSLLLLIPFLLQENGTIFFQRIIRLYAWFPLVATLTFLLIVFIPELSEWRVFGKIPFLEYKKGDLAVQLLISTLLILSGRIQLNPRLQLITFGLIAYLFFVVATFNRGGMVAFIGSVSLFIFWNRKSVFLQQFKPYLRVAPLVLLVTLFLYTATRMSDPIQGRSIGLDQLKQNVVSIVSKDVEGSLSDNIVWRLAWWGKIIDYTFAGPYFLTGKGLGINLAASDEIPMDEETDRTPLRAPHSFHLNILARYGVPVFILWLVFIFYLVRGLIFKNRSVDNSLVACILIAALINASFDVALEGPMAAFPFWIWVGLSLARQQTPLPTSLDRL
jgi:hypothetical protein